MQRLEFGQATFLFLTSRVEHYRANAEIHAKSNNRSGFIMANGIVISIQLRPKVIHT